MEKKEEKPDSPLELQKAAGFVQLLMKPLPKVLGSLGNMENIECPQINWEKKKKKKMFRKMTK